MKGLQGATLMARLPAQGNAVCLHKQVCSYVQLQHIRLLVGSDDVAYIV